MGNDINPVAKGANNNALNHNPNEGINDGPNGAPCGPYSHMLGQTDDGGYDGNTSVKGKNGATFNFK
ncbi:MAG: hypothetical protein AB7I50_23330 [Vicinamibacterales bacterium]